MRHLLTITDWWAQSKGKPNVIAKQHNIPWQTVVDKPLVSTAWLQDLKGCLKEKLKGGERQSVCRKPFVKGEKELSQCWMFVCSQKQRHPKGHDRERSHEPLGWRESNMLEIKPRKWVAKHRLVFAEGAPVSLANVIMSFLARNGSKFKGPVNVGVQVTNIQPFSEQQQFMPWWIALRCLWWANKMGVAQWVGRCNVIRVVKLEPVSLVDCVITPISRMVNIKFKEELTVKHAWRIKRHGVHESHPC